MLIVCIAHTGSVIKKTTGSHARPSTDLLGNAVMTSPLVEGNSRYPVKYAGC